MKCCSRSTLGVVIGSLNVVAYLGVIIYLIISTVSTKQQFEKHEQTFSKTDATLFNVIYALLILYCLAMLAISGLLVMGIIKRRHKLMMPWLILSAIGFVINVFRFAYQFIYSMTEDLGAGYVIQIFFTGVIVLGISGLIIWLIYTLYKDIEEQTIAKPTAAHGY